MNTAILNLILAILSGIASWGVFSSLRKNKEILFFRDFAYFFFFFIFFFLSQSVFLLTQNLQWVSIGHIVAIFFFYIMLAFALKVPLSFLGLAKQKVGFFCGVLLAVGSFVIAAHIYDFRMVIVDTSGFIFWNANLFATWLLSLSGLVVASMWVLVFSKNLLHFIRNMQTELHHKIKNALLIGAAFTFGLGSMTYFFAFYYSILASFVFLFVGFVCFLTMLSVD